MTDDQEEQIARGKARAEAEALLSAEHLQEVVGTYAGRAVLWELLSECRIYSDGFCGGAKAAMAFEAGKRNLGLSLLEKVLTVNSEAYILMRNEASARKRTLDERYKPQEQE